MRIARGLWLSSLVCLLGASAPSCQTGLYPPAPETEILVNGNGGCVRVGGEVIPYTALGCLNNLSVTPEAYRLRAEWEEELIRIIEEKENCDRGAQ